MEENRLYRAVCNGNDYEVKRLIDSGVSPNTSVFGETPLDQAVIKRNVSMVEYLLTKLADVNNSGTDCDSMPLHYASKGRFIRNPDLNQKDFEDSIQIMKILLKNGASVNLFDKYSRTPLHYAVEEWFFRSEKIRLLLDYKADVNAHQGAEPPPIFFSPISGAVVQMLIDKGANVNYIRESTSGTGSLNTPLSFAFYMHDLTMVDILLENGAQIDRFIVKYSFKIKIEYPIHEVLIDRMKDITPMIEILIHNGQDDYNIIPILASKHFQREVTINSKEFSSASGIFFARFKECQEELERMQDLKVVNLSLLDILAMPIKKLRNYTKNEDILKILWSGIVQDEFPVYSDIIMRRFKKANEERDLIDSSCVAFQKFIFSIHEIHLPDPVVYKIVMDFLHVVDRKKLTELSMTNEFRTEKRFIFNFIKMSI